MKATNLFINAPVQNNMKTIMTQTELLHFTCVSISVDVLLATILAILDSCAYIQSGKLTSAQESQEF